MQVRKRLVFTAVMLLIPVAFFAAVEGTLRLTGYGASYPLFVTVEGKPEYLYQNREVARRYFVNIHNVPSSLADFFEAEKDTNTFRIFVQGGSSAAGFPFYYGGSFSRMLEQRLMQTFPERHIEVVNTSMAAVNSYTILDLADEILEHEPDAVLIYAGHNEYYGALGIGSSESLGSQPWLVRSYLALSDLRLTQALRRFMGWTVQVAADRESGQAPSESLMSRMVGEQSIPYGSADYAAGLRQFRSNLSRVLRKYSDHGVPVFIGSLASNERDHEPFISGFQAESAKEKWQDHYDAALNASGPDAALQALEQAIQIDSLNADAYFAMGRVLEGTRRFPEARAAFVAAKDRDELRFRAPEAMNGIIQELADRYGATVVDTRGALAGRSANGIIGSDVMTEHLHPNVEGYFAIADAFYDALRRASLVGDWTSPVSDATARSEILLTPVDSLVGIFRIRQLMAGWPFQPPGVVKPWSEGIDASDPVVRIALRLVRGEISWREANEEARLHYEEKGDYHHALQAALAHLQEFPFVPQPYLVAGNILVKQGRLNEALVYFRSANDVEETSSAHRMIGSILLEHGQRDVAVPHLERAIVLDPNNTTALYNLGGAYALERQYEKARETVKRLLEIRPDHTDGRRLLASLPSS